MGKKEQYTSVSSANTAGANPTPVPEGFLQLVTSAGNTLAFNGPAELYSYQQNPANATQLGKAQGLGDQRGK